MDSGLEPIPITSQKHDPAWKHCQMFKNGERVELKCIYCSKVFKGGGIHRIKEHLAGQKGNASTCSRVPPDVRALMQQSLDGVVVKKRNRQKLDEEITNIKPRPHGEVESLAHQDDVNSGIQFIGVPDTLEPDTTSLVVNREEGATSSRNADRRKRGRGKNSSARDAVGVGVSNSAGLGSKKVNNYVHMAIGRFLYDIGAPLDAVNSAYFQPMIDAIASGGSGILLPSYHDLRGWILKNSVEEVKNDIHKCRATWERTGCSILVDQWDSEDGRVILSFFVHSPEGTMFLRTEDASETINSSDALYELLKGMVEEVGEKHVLQVITTGSKEQYIAAGRRLTETFTSLYWAPCAAHSIDLILEDFGNIDWISEVIEQGRSITRFVYNHSEILNMVRRYTFGNDIIEPEATRFATNFTTLKRLVDLKHNLQAMITSQEWVACLYSKKKGGLEMSDCISNQSFWSSCNLIIHLTNSLLRVLRIVSNQKRPGMGYVYAAMYRAKEAIKKELVKKEDYTVYWDIIDHRWEQQRNLPLHAAGFYLNPKYFYSIEGDLHNDILSGILDCIERLIPDTKVQDKISKEIISYKNAAGDFGRKMAIRTRDTLLPAEWWSTYGGGCPNLARLAIRILSQTCSLIGYKRNQVCFQKLHDTGNSLEHQRLSDLVFVQHNLRLRQMVVKSNGQESIDPISSDNTSVVENWVRSKDIHLEPPVASYWMAVDPPSANTMLLGAANDEAEDLGTGFNDYEIFCSTKDGEEENAEDNVVV
ncbi:Zinc finger, BED-type domain containing protein [Trema orientale]|uniref:Zinc finger, BED-type domain containing protein n=1 Tax=Trema orientale TaxID=63057 RepID=A0A2P5CX40_TREOI|nr:Zinc finger, BED-type domain containing protein [Trema orientale]